MSALKADMFAVRRYNPHPMPATAYTPEQLRAIQATGSSVLVSAAAGSGKTAVLAERCVYLLCDAPAEHRCEIDELLVVTFTEAAADEMRSRIIDALRDRAARSPADESLRRQIALAESAQISTIHAYCLWIVRRWFSLLGIDPAATVLDANEAALLRRETLEELFQLQYAPERSAEDPLGTKLDDGASAQEHSANSCSVALHGRRIAADEPRRYRESENARAAATPPPEVAEPGALTGTVSAASGAASPFQERLVRLIDVYGLGEDRDIAALVLRLADFANSLTDPDGWLDEAVDRLRVENGRLLADLAGEFERELTRQHDHCAAVADALACHHPALATFSTLIHVHAERLGEWAKALDSIGGRCAETLERVRCEIVEYPFPRAPATRNAATLPADVLEALTLAKGEFKSIRESMFQRRLQKRFALFPVEEWNTGVTDTVPFVRTIVDLVRLFRRTLQARKRSLGVMEFADLERFAFDLLAESGDDSKPSEVARSIHRRFKHVLVDEFQDVNPLQEGILRLSSCESDPAACGNFFAVGDVKQSIYRFRLAEPGVFTRRLGLFRKSPACGRALALQRNFRSRAEILIAVNRVFGILMRDEDAGAIYDDDAQLRPGREATPAVAADQGGSTAVLARVEVHVLPSIHARSSNAAPSQDGSVPPEPETPDGEAAEEDEFGDDSPSSEYADETGFSTEFDASRWSAAEREAFLIGSRILQWRKDGDVVIGDRALQFRDVAVLLRSAKFKAEQMVSMLSRMGIPARAETGGSLFASVEVRDVLAALRVLDNPQQDIPLAAVLRNGIFGAPLTADELVEIRRLDRGVPFHAAARRYVDTGESEPLRDRLRRVLQRIDAYRHEARLRPLSDLLWRLYEREGYLAFAAALPHGEQRRANLLRLHDLARSFGTFRRQGLHRFLRFVDSLDSAEQSVDTAASLGESEDVVRIMSVHRAKGLEFPVVFVAGLGTGFNLQERKGRMIFERSAKIGLRVVDRERMIEYPSAAHLLVGAEIDRCTRQEEMRILYVAMTRARDRLVLVGTPTARSRSRSIRLDVPSTAHARTSATSMLDWILPIAGSPSTASDDVFELHEHGSAEILDWRIAPAAGTESGSAAAASNESAVLSAVVQAAPLPTPEPLGGESAEVDEILHRIAHVYPLLSVTSVAATSSASRFEGFRDVFDQESLATTPLPPRERGRGEGSQDGRVSRIGVLKRATASGEPSSESVIEADGRTGAQSTNDAVRRGVVTHRVLQHLDFAKATDGGGLALELQRMTADGVVTSDEAELIPRDGLEWFLGAPLAERIRRAGSQYRRELSYIAAESPRFFDPGVTCDASDFALVRGIVDGILLGDDGAEVVDFKTDAVSAAGAEVRAKRYAPQMELYSRAVRRLFRCPVTTCRLVFLSAQCIVDWMPCATAL